MQVDVYRVRSVVASFRIDERTKLIQRFFGENYIAVEFEAHDVLDIAIGDYLVYNTIRYYVNTLPKVVKQATNRFLYSVTFESEYYDLAKIQFMLNGSADFDYVTNLEGFVDLLITNLNRIYGAGTWVKGTCNQSDLTYRLMHFQAENCRQIVQRVCKEFSCEVFFDRKAIHVTDKMGHSTGLTLKYRYGLRGITRNTLSDKNIVTRLYAFGSERNIDSTYGTPRLQLPVTKNFVTNGGFETENMTGWGVWGSPTSRGVNNTTPGGYQSKCSYYHKATGGNDGSEQVSITVVPNTMYTLSAWVRVTSTGSSNGIRVMTYNGTAYQAAHVKAKMLLVWQKVSVTFTTGVAQTSLSVWAGGIGEAFFDNIQLERGSNATAFVNGSARYLEENAETYGTIEHTELFDNVYPHRDGAITSVDPSDVTVFTDSGMDFNVNSYLISGVTAKIHFQTGGLAGYTFEIETYDNGTKTFTIIPVSMQDGKEYPNATVKPAVNDKFVILDIKMPPTYITEAEETLFTLAKAYIDDNCLPRVTYELAPDPRYFKNNGILLNIGDEVTVSDANLGVDKSVRVIELIRSLVNQYDYAVKISESTEGSISQRLYDDGATLKSKAAVDKAGDIVKARMNWRSSEELKNMVFDQDGYFTAATRPLSIETTLLAVGSKSQSFILKEVQFKPNLTGNNNAISITAGTLIHLAVDITDHTGIGVWTLVANETYQAGGLTTGTAYYLYARCHKTDYSHANNTIVIDTTAKSVNQGDYWYFLVGVLHSTTGSEPRGISLTYGQTLVNGKFITTGRIQSANGQTYFDLDNNTLVIGSASGYSNISDKPTTLAGINAGEGSKLTGIAAGATVGATWGVNVASVPSVLTSVGDNSLVVSNNFIGFHGVGEEWPVRIKNNAGAGEFFCGEATKYISYNVYGGVQVRGIITVQAGSNVEVGADVTSNHTAANASTYTGAAIATSYTAAKCTNANADQTSANIAAAIANLPATPSGAGLFCSATHLGYYDSSAWKAYIKNDGTFYFGGNATNAIAWNGTTLTVRGLLTADDIVAGGTITGNTLRTAASGKRVIVSGSANNIQIYSAAESIITIDDDVSGDTPGVFINSSYGGIFIARLDANNYSSFSHSNLSITHNAVVANVLHVAIGASANFTVTSDGEVNSTYGYKKSGTKVIGAQGAAVADASDDPSSLQSALNALLARCRAHGLIAT